MHSNGSYKQNEKATHWKGEGICRKYTPNIHGGHTIQQQKKSKQPDLKMGRGFE